MPSTTIGVIAALLSAFLWGTTFAATKLGLAAVPPFTLAALRGIIASIVLITIVMLRREGNSLTTLFRNQPFIAILLGLTGIFLLNAFQNFGIARTSSAVASVVLNTNPFIIAILAASLLHERLHLAQRIGMGLGFIGILLIVLMSKQGNIDHQSQTFIGNLLVGGAAEIGREHV